MQFHPIAVHLEGGIIKTQTRKGNLIMGFSNNMFKQSHLGFSSYM